MMPEPISTAGQVAGSKAPGDSVTVAINAMKHWLSSDPNPAPSSPKPIAEPVNELASCYQPAFLSAVSPQIKIAVSPDKIKPKVPYGFVDEQSSDPSHLQAHRGSETSYHMSSPPLKQSDSSHNMVALDQQSPGPAGEYTVPIKGKRDENTEPLPAPLHVIEAATSHGNVSSQKKKRSRDTWSVSDLEDAKIGQKDTSGVALAYDTVPRMTSMTDSSVDIDVQPVPSFPMADKEHSSQPLSAGLDDTFIGLWVMNATEPPSTVYLPKDCSLPAFRQCDIDSCTGKLLPPTPYPDTLQSRIEGMCRDYRDIGWRHTNMTSELQIVRELKSRQRLAEHIRVSLHQNQLFRVPVEASVFEEDSFPSAECTLRPATPADFERIAENINLESQKADCPQVFESKAVSVADIEGIFQYCETNLRPFIVALPAEEDMLDRSKWPKNSERAYQEYVRFKKTQPSCPPVVVGFAFVGEQRMGFLDAPCPGSRYSGQVRVIVHPEHRQQSYGTALLDRALLSMSSYHSNLIAYEWQCPAPAHIYESPVGYNDRQYARVYVEMYCESKNTADFQWRAEMLAKFNFDEIAHIRQAVKTDRDGKSKWLDLVLWAFEANPTSAIKDTAT
ncbi:hypothetical protein TOPH_07424 [Tolypocladium ophioglossoides CBS 100239]|uniref:N-acetyltransferase domain-containing protein n=1 Tax=Tolypocladium ophioglossoides (strain CBS 100239) TaxID=1163406 RepID=A0A0L0N1J2_TOLOC|nr:hypothetical protein TOPH_07424 [Tolypocladium ophioglossoides CBS 100239]